jgi:YidC/Oxa1 family membrane protein insertase
MLLTLPVLFAFYSMLSQAIELRGAPFVGWITDLSTYDPSFITPLLMGATMVWQQKIQPSTADPVQQKVMMFMPIMFTFMFLWAPSGLVLYWLISNVWAIGQQYLTNAITGAPAGVPAKPARAGQ